MLVAAGDCGGRRLSVAGEGLPGGTSTRWSTLHQMNEGHPLDLTGKNVVVIGGGNVAIDSARSALRLGARSVKMFCLESRAEMPATPGRSRRPWTKESSSPLRGGWVRFVGYDHKVASIELIRCTAVFDQEHRFNPSFDRAVQQSVRAERASSRRSVSRRTPRPFPPSSRSSAMGRSRSTPRRLRARFPESSRAGTRSPAPR